MTPDQQRAVEQFRALRGVEPFGPFVPLLRSPELMAHVSALGEYLRFRSALPQRLSELAILVTAACWNQAFEWNVHAPIARDAGVAQQVIDAIAERRAPTGLQDDERALYELCMALHAGRGAGAEVWQRARRTLGEQGAMDAVGICGYYALLAMILNTENIPS